METITPGRRRLLRGLAGLLLLPAAARAAMPAPAPTTVNVMTSYPDELMSRFEAVFEQAHPRYRLRFLWRMPHDALPYLESQSGADTVDVYWAASPRTFARLKEKQLLRKLDLGQDQAGLPASIGKARISDPDGYYVATELAGYVLAYNERKLASLGVAVPDDWPGLANPALLDNIALPVPSEVGYAPVMFDIVLQAYGWERGWALWSEVSALSRLVRRGSSFISEQVATGEIAIGLSIDFFVKAALANGATVAQRYPWHNGVNPGQIALPVAGHNDAGARAFAAFVLSPRGQALLLERDIRKLPVSPQAYAAVTPGDFNPYAAAARGAMDYDGERGRERLNIISAIFDQMLAQPHDELRALWRRVYAAEALGKDVRTVRALLSRPPLDEAGADQPALGRQFRADLEGGKPQDNGVTAAWSAACAAYRREAGQLLERAGA